MGLLDKLKGKSNFLKKPEILISSVSPLCPIDAFAENDGQTCYFYLQKFPKSKKSELIPCFVCNTVGSEQETSLDEWYKHHDWHAPMIPYSQVSHDKGGMTLSPDELEIVWTREGSGAGLLYRNELIAFIPEWADVDNICGYSKYIIGKTDFGWEMTNAQPHLDNVIAAAKDFWSKMDEDFWPELQQSQLNSIESFMGEHDKYYAIDGGKFPPRALVTGEKDGIKYGFTLGMSLLRQPMTECFYMEKTDDFTRVELGFSCSAEQEKAFMSVLQRMASSATLPWAQITSLGHGHTITLKGVSGFPAAWLINDNLLPEGNSPEYEPVYGERVNLLWLVPITQEQYDYLREYDMEKIFKLNLSRDMLLFDGKSKLPMELLREAAATPAEQNCLGDSELESELADMAREMLVRGTDYDDPAASKYKFGYLFDIEDHGIEALFKLITDKTVCYFAVQSNTMLRLDIDEEIFADTTEKFLALYE